MTAAAARAELAAIGGDLAPLLGEAGWRRGQVLLGRAADEPIAFADLALAPDWLRRSKAELTDLARRAALVAMAPALAVSIDGAWLGELADRAGEPALDAAIGAAERVPGGGLPALPADRLEGVGFELLRAALPPTLRRYLAWAAGEAMKVPTALANFCVEEAVQR